MSNKEKVKGLRALADFMEENPDMEVLFSAANVFVDNLEDLQKYGRKLGTFTKRTSSDWFYLRRDFDGGIRLEINATHNQVCERVVVGTEEIQVPDPAAPKITKTVDIVEWNCPEILSKVEKEDD